MACWWIIIKTIAQSTRGCMRGWFDALLPEAKDNGVSGHPMRRGAKTFNITQPTIIPFIIQPTLYRVIAAPVAEWVRSLYFSALNHSIISPLCLV